MCVPVYMWSGGGGVVTPLPLPLYTGSVTIDAKTTVCIVLQVPPWLFCLPYK